MTNKNPHLTFLKSFFCTHGQLHTEVMSLLHIREINSILLSHKIILASCSTLGNNNWPTWDVRNDGFRNTV